MMTYSPRFLALAALVAIPFGAASAVEQAGVTAAVQGNIDFLSVLDERVHRARGGEDIYLGDEINSQRNSGMQLMLLDETIFTIGPETDLTIDEFVYDPATGAGQMSVSLTKGVFRFVAGKIAQGDPEDMQINLPAGTIGIRGTSGIVSIINDRTPAMGNAPAELVQGSVLVVLLETGGENIHESGLVVSAQGQSIELTEPGFGTILAPNQPPVVPFLVDTSFYASEQAMLAPSASRKDAPDEAQDAPGDEPGGEPGDPAFQGENEPGQPDDGDGQPAENDGPATADGEPIEGDGHFNADGEPIEGDGYFNADGEPIEGDGYFNADGEPIEGDGYFNADGEPIEGDGGPFENDGQHADGDGQFFDGDGQHADGDGQFFEGDGYFSADGEPIQGDGYFSADGEPIQGDGYFMADGGYDDGGYDDGGYGDGDYDGGGYDGGGFDDGGYYGGDGFYDGGYDDGGYGDGDYDGGGFDDGGYYGGDGFYGGGFGDNFFGEGGFGDDFFGGDGFGGEDFYGDYDMSFEHDMNDPYFDCPDCFNFDGSIHGVATVSDFADVFALFGTASYGGVRDFFQILQGGSPVNIKGQVTFNLSIDFDARKFCLSACTISVNTSSFGGNISDSTSVNTVTYSGRSGSAFQIFTDADLTNSNFNGTEGDLFNFNDGTSNIIANNMVVIVTYDDGGGNRGGTPGFTPTDPGAFAP